MCLGVSSPRVGRSLCLGCRTLVTGQVGCRGSEASSGCPSPCPASWVIPLTVPSSVSDLPMPWGSPTRDHTRVPVLGVQGGPWGCCFWRVFLALGGPRRLLRTRVPEPLSCAQTGGLWGARGALPLLARGAPSCYVGLSTALLSVQEIIPETLGSLGWRRKRQCAQCPGALPVWTPLRPSPWAPRVALALHMELLRDPPFCAPSLPSAVWPCRHTGSLFPQPPRGRQSPGCTMGGPWGRNGHRSLLSSLGFSVLSGVS